MIDPGAQRLYTAPVTRTEVGGGRASRALVPKAGDSARLALALELLGLWEGDMVEGRGPTSHACLRLPCLHLLRPLPGMLS